MILITRYSGPARPVDLVRNFVEGIEVMGDVAALTYTIPMPIDAPTSESASVLDFVKPGPLRYETRFPVPPALRGHSPFRRSLHGAPVCAPSSGTLRPLCPDYRHRPPSSLGIPVRGCVQAACGGRGRRLRGRPARIPPFKLDAITSANPTYIFTELRVGYRMPRGEMRGGSGAAS